MASVCFYFQVHQPNRLRRYSVFDSSDNYFDDYHNEQILRKVAGILATAIMISFGAPFWNDVLRSLLGLRGGLSRNKA